MHILAFFYNSRHPSGRLSQAPRDLRYQVGRRASRGEASHPPRHRRPFRHAPGLDSHEPCAPKVFSLLRPLVYMLCVFQLYCYDYCANANCILKKIVRILKSYFPLQVSVLDLLGISSNPEVEVTTIDTGSKTRTLADHYI